MAQVAVTGLMARPIRDDKRLIGWPRLAILTSGGNPLGKCQIKQEGVNLTCY